MPKLSQMKCEACRADSPHVTHDEVTEFMQQTPGWQITKEEDTNKLEKVFFFRDWNEALGFTIKVGELAELQGHHPMVVTEWGRVKVVWWTHKIRGLHKNDFIMAAKTEEVASEAAAQRKAGDIKEK